MFFLFVSFVSFLTHFFGGGFFSGDAVGVKRGYAETGRQLGFGCMI